MAAPTRFFNYYHHLGISAKEDRASISKKIRQALKANHPDRHARESEENKRLLEQRTILLNEAKEIFSSNETLQKWKKVNFKTLHDWFNARRDTQGVATDFFDPEFYLTRGASKVDDPPQPLTKEVVILLPAKQATPAAAQPSIVVQTASSDKQRNQQQPHQTPAHTVRSEKDELETQNLPKTRDDEAGEAPTASHQCGKIRKKGLPRRKVDHDGDLPYHSHVRSRPAFRTNKSKSKKRASSTAADDSDESLTDDDSEIEMDGPSRRTRLKTWKSHSRPGLYGFTVENQFQSIPGYLDSYGKRLAAECGFEEGQRWLPTVLSPERIRTPY